MIMNNGNFQFHQTNTKQKQGTIQHKQNNNPSLSYTPFHTQITPNPKIFQRTHQWILNPMAREFSPLCVGMIGSGTQCLLELPIMDTHIPLFSPPHNLGLELLLKCSNYNAYIVVEGNKRIGAQSMEHKEPKETPWSIEPWVSNYSFLPSTQLFNVVIGPNLKIIKWSLDGTWLLVDFAGVNLRESVRWCRFERLSIQILKQMGCIKEREMQVASRICAAYGGCVIYSKSGYFLKSRTHISYWINLISTIATTYLLVGPTPLCFV